MQTAELENGVSLQYEVHGEITDPVVLIILGITDNITDWPEGLYQPLVDNGFCVVRYELRDSGLSSKFETDGVADLASAKAALQLGQLPKAGYTIVDMAQDAKLLLDHLGIEAACVAGYSYGAAVAQHLTLEQPHRVAGLVCLQGSNYKPDLPARSPGVEKAMIEATIDYTDTEQCRNAIQNLRLATNGSVHAMDEKEARASAITSVGRMYYPQGTARIVLSRFATPAFYERTAAIGCPTLILHADNDPIFSIEHGEEMAQRIPNARLSILQGAGHNHPLSLQPIIAAELVQFCKFTFGK